MSESVEIISRLPSCPIYMSIMETIDGKPKGMSVWNSFENIEAKRIMNNESMASTFLSLAKNLSDMAEDVDKDGKIMRVSLNKKTYNIYSPHPNDDFQISFVVVFEDKDSILIDGKAKEDLVRRIVEVLRNNKNLRNHLDSVSEKRISKDTPLYLEVSKGVSEAIVKWDQKRVRYLEEEMTAERDRVLTELAAQAVLDEAPPGDKT